MPAETQHFTSSGQATEREAVNFRFLTDEVVAWNATGDPLFPYEAYVAGTRCLIRLNDFPAETLFTLMVDGEEIVSFNDWPRLWSKMK